MQKKFQIEDKIEEKIAEWVIQNKQNKKRTKQNIYMYYLPQSHFGSSKMLILTNSFSSTPLKFAIYGTNRGVPRQERYLSLIVAASKDLRRPEFFLGGPKCEIISRTKFRIKNYSNKNYFHRLLSALVVSPLGKKNSIPTAK